eukprot:349839-Chlamydomonas_euryale.AAC.2
MHPQAVPVGSSRAALHTPHPAESGRDGRHSVAAGGTGRRWQASGRDSRQRVAAQGRGGGKLVSVMARRHARPCMRWHADAFRCCFSSENQVGMSFSSENQVGMSISSENQVGMSFATPP